MEVKKAVNHIMDTAHELGIDTIEFIGSEDDIDTVTMYFDGVPTSMHKEFKNAVSNTTNHEIEGHFKPGEQTCAFSEALEEDEAVVESKSNKLRMIYEEYDGISIGQRIVELVSGTEGFISAIYESSYGGVRCDINCIKGASEVKISEIPLKTITK